jgi:hypothetical protein
MEKMVKVIALVEEEKRRRLYHVLLDEDISFAEWLRRQIDAYLEAKEPTKTASRRRRGVK